MRDGFGMRNFMAITHKLPAFDVQKDDMDAYLESYEPFATSQEWDKGDWPVSLSPLIMGKDYKSTLLCQQVVQTTMKSCRLLYCSGMSLPKMDFIGNSEKTNQKIFHKMD